MDKNIMKTALITGIDNSIIAHSICVSLLKSNYSIIAITEGKYDITEKKRIEFDITYSDLSPVSFEVIDVYSNENIKNIISKFSNISFDVIINCASILAETSDGKLRDESVNFDYTEFNRVLSYNITSVAAICLGLKDNIKFGGNIINITSSAGQEGAFSTISYNASKSAIDNITKSLANILGVSKGIRVNSIAPGWIPPSDDVAAEGVVALANALTPSLSSGKPSDVVAAVHYLIASNFQNGSVLNVDGGIQSSYLPYMLESLQLQGKPIDETIETLISLISSAKSSAKLNE